MDASVEVWETQPWHFPLVHNHVHKTLTLLIFLLQCSTKLPRMITKLPRMMSGRRGRYDPVAMDPTAMCPITRTPKWLRDQASMHRGS